MKRFIVNLFYILLVFNYVTAEDLTVTTIIKNTASCNNNNNNDGNTGTDSHLTREENNNENSCNCQPEPTSTQRRLEHLESLFKQNRVNLCGVGMQDYRIKENQLSSSGYYQMGATTGHSHIYSRLFNTENGARAWCALMSDTNKWLQLDFGEETEIVGVAIQGQHTSNSWTTLYKIQYKSTESDEFAFVPSGNNQNTFQGSTDHDTPSVTSFTASVRGRYFRIVPVEWHGHPCIRFDFLRC